MNLWQEYKRPASVTEAIKALISAPGPAMPIAGGTDLLLDLKQGRHAPVHTLIDLTFIPEMTALELRGAELYIGAAVPVSGVARDPLVAAHAQALTEACNLIAGLQVRNVATLGGNVAHALPAADGTIALLALNAQAEIASTPTAGRVTAERRIETSRVPFKELFLGPGKSSLKHGQELLVGFYLPLSKKGQDSCFKRIMRPQGVALPFCIALSGSNEITRTSRMFTLLSAPAAGLPSASHKPKMFYAANLSPKPYLHLHLKPCLPKPNFAPVRAAPAQTIAGISLVDYSRMCSKPPGDGQMFNPSLRA
jgi:CO/xanthine dehydrogenase FAD-binding subunit